MDSKRHLIKKIRKKDDNSQKNIEEIDEIDGAKNLYVTENKNSKTSGVFLQRDELKNLKNQFRIIIDELKQKILKKEEKT